jgi:hypothetical protein
MNRFEGETLAHRLHREGVTVAECVDIGIERRLERDREDRDYLETVPHG